MTTNDAVSRSLCLWLQNLIVIRLNTRGVGWNEPAADTAIFHTNSKSKSGCFKDNCRNDSKHTLSLLFAWNQVALVGLLRNRLKWRFQVGTRGTHGRRRVETRSSCNAEIIRDSRKSPTGGFLSPSNEPNTASLQSTGVFLSNQSLFER